MTDKEMAEKYRDSHEHYTIAMREDGTEYADKVSDVTIKQAFLDGLKTKKAELSKAKELIRDLLSCLYSVEYNSTSDLEEAEQFLEAE